MVHTLPPWTTKYKMVKIFGQIDSGELAARLGSINTFDRRGNVSWYDDFESSTLKWCNSPVGAGGTGALSTTHARNGNQSFKMVTDTVSGRGRRLLKRLPSPTNANIGLELHIATEHQVWTLEAEVEVQDTEGIQAMTVRWVEETNLLQVKDENSDWQTVATLGNKINDVYLFYTIKIVADFEAKTYKRLMFNDTEYNISNIRVKDTAGPYLDILCTKIAVTTNQDSAKTCYIDDVIITQNEP